MKTVLLYIATAFAEIVGCYLPWLWIRQGGSAWLLVPAVASLALSQNYLVHKAARSAQGRQGWRTCQISNRNHAWFLTASSHACLESERLVCDVLETWNRAHSECPLADSAY
jgi:hypothetical protein